MRYFVLVLVLAFSTLNAAAFAGLEYGWSSDQVKAQLENRDIKIREEGDKGIIFETSLFGTTFEGMCFVDGTGLNQIVLMSKSRYDRYDLLSRDFENIKNAFINKYGESSNSINHFFDPYELGDGYEMSALRIGKHTRVTRWELDDQLVGVMAAKDGKINVLYVSKEQQNKDQEKKSQLNDNL